MCVVGEAARYRVRSHIFRVVRDDDVRDGRSVELEDG